MQLGAFVLDLAVRTISIADLLGPQPLFNAVFTKPLFALEAFLWIENHIVAYDTCEFILIIFLVDETSNVYYLIWYVLNTIHTII